eukprot:CAMPEP_0177611724 /NCGR_PEP_ID=MMETSP0419_2-20121207/20703_1 /TAXON_ID=582737 /ORGANISM="Tetraselmis sp., Strain GSL018" /LENGTH=74 /DNA_ID=CAMNT_0019107591 /DNA_START=21 /DNA_END=241 /DNA_ORIENTATION=+
MSPIPDAGSDVSCADITPAEATSNTPASSRGANTGYLDVAHTDREEVGESSSAEDSKPECRFCLEKGKGDNGTG